MSPSDSMDNKLWQTHPWELLAEFLLPGGYAKNDQESENASNQLIEAAGDLGLATTQLNRINTTLKNAARNAIKHNIQKGSKEAIAIRLYYLRKQPEQPDEGETLDADIDNPIPNVNGTGPPEVVQKAFEPDPPAGKGWGYFLTERKIETSGSSSGEPTSLIELFLYTEER